MAITKPSDTVYLSLSGNFSSQPWAPRPSPQLDSHSMRSVVRK